MSSIIRTKEDLKKYRAEKKLSIEEKEKTRIESIREEVKNWLETPSIMSPLKITELKEKHQEFQTNKIFLTYFDELMNGLSSDDSNGTFCKTFDCINSDQDKHALDLVANSFSRLGYDVFLSIPWRDCEVYFPYDEIMTYVSSNNNMEINFFRSSESKRIGAKIKIS